MLFDSCKKHQFMRSAKSFELIITKILSDTMPLCFLSEKKLLIFKYDTIKILDLNTFHEEFVHKFSLSFFNNIISRNSLYSRIFRYGIRTTVKFSDNLIIFVFLNKIFELDLIKKTISSGYKLTKKSRPLNFTLIKGINGFEDGLYFGEYKYNPQKYPVSIYRRLSEDNWIEVFKFSEGEINHIHNIIPDPYNNIVYILTGDFDNAAAIWHSSDGFKNVKPIFRNQQIFRSCIAFPTQQGLLYATDSPFSQNSIRLLTFKEGKWDSKELAQINGPCIYGCIWKNNFIFSTSVEGDGLNNSLFTKLFSTKIGKGIKFNSSIIYIGNLTEGFVSLYEQKKDIFPFYSFQFGVLVFASGINNSNFLPVYHIATQKNDMNCIILEIKNK